MTVVFVASRRSPLGMFSHVANRDCTFFASDCAKLKSPKQSARHRALQENSGGAKAPMKNDSFCHSRYSNAPLTLQVRESTAAYRVSQGPSKEGATSQLEGSITGCTKVTSTTFDGGKLHSAAWTKVAGPRRTGLPFCMRVAPELQREK
jgi:hypothetical protein